METHPCPKCSEPLDQGELDLSRNSYIGYVSNKQTGMLRTLTKITDARACTNCGYVEFFLNPKELQQKIS